MNDHVRSRYLGWREGDERERSEVGRHLGECADCRRYYEEMDRLLDPALIAVVPEISPDPRLPDRIAGLSRTRKLLARESRSAGMALVVEGGVFAAAIVIGVVLGLSLRQDQPPGGVEEIVDLYRDAVQADDDAGRFNPVPDESEWELQ